MNVLLPDGIRLEGVSEEFALKLTGLGKEDLQQPIIRRRKKRPRNCVEEENLLPKATVPHFDPVLVKKRKRQKKHPLHQSRMKWIQARRKHLMKEYPYWDYAKAFRFAATEWNVKFGKMPCKKADTGRKTITSGLKTFALGKTPPKVFLDEESNQLFLGMLKNMVQKGGVLKYEPDGRMLGIDSSFQWQAVLDKVFVLSKDIADFFGVKNKFVVEKRGRETVLAFGGGW